MGWGFLFGVYFDAEQLKIIGLDLKDQWPATNEAVLDVLLLFNRNIDHGFKCFPTTGTLHILTD